MKNAFLILLITASANAAVGLAPGLRVKFDMRGTPGVDYFFKLPRTVPEAEAAGWGPTRGPDGPLPQLVLYCPRDRVVCAYMDDIGNVAGLQVAIRKDKFTDNPLDWARRGFTSWKTTVDGQPVKFWTIQEYFVSEDTLKKSKEERLAAHDHSRILQEGAVWFTGTDRKLLKVSTKEEDFKNSIFTKQDCLPAMGNHYYFNITTRTECVPEQIYPWFILAFRGEVVGMGFLTFGRLQRENHRRDWFERPGLPTIKAVVPYGPDCMYNLASIPGAITLHIYMVDDPIGITCEPQQPKQPQLPIKPSTVKKY